jgi:hypothetical protein
MAQRHLDFGTSVANDGETIHSAFQKIEDNTVELYARVGGVSSINGQEGTVVLDATEIDISSFSPSSYTPVDASIEGHLEGVDAALTVIGEDSFTQAGVGAVERTRLTKLRETVTLQDFGAVGDGVADDAPALQVAINHIRTLSDGGAIRAPAGDYRLASEIDLRPLKNIMLYGDGDATNFIIDYNGAEKVAFKATNTVPSDRLSAALVLRDFQISYGAGVTDGPVTFEHRYASNLTISNVNTLHYKNNTIWRLSGVWNCNFAPSSLWGGGYNCLWKDATGITFSITQGTTTLTASGAHFSADDVGKAILVAGTRRQLYVIAGYTDSTTVTVTEAAVTAASAASGVWEPIRGTINSASSSLTINRAGLTSADIGRVCYVIGALDGGGGTPGLLRATITGVSGTTITLDTAATLTATDAYVVISPAVEMFDEDSWNITNDAAFYDLHLEQIRGCGLVVRSGINLVFHHLKLHGQNEVFSRNCTAFRAIFSEWGGYATGEFEGQCVNALGSTLLVGSTGSSCSFPNMLGAETEGQSSFYSANNHASVINAVGDVWITNTVSDATLRKCVRNGTSGRLRGPTNLRSYQNANGVYRLIGDKIVHGSGLPPYATTVGKHVAAGDGNTYSEVVSAGGSPSFVGSNYGGTLGSPTATVDFATIAELIGRGYLSNGSMFTAARILARGRNPLAASMEGELLLATASGGTLTNRWGILSNGHLYPIVDDTYDIGASGFAARHIYGRDIELGHASDTTLARAAAGVLSVEGRIQSYIKAQSWVQAKVVGASSTAETVLATISFAANELGNNGSIEVIPLFSGNNSANAKNFKVRLGASGAGTGGTALCQASSTTNISTKLHQTIANRNSASSQIANGVLGDDGIGQGAADYVYPTINTASAFEIVLTGQCASSAANEEARLEGYIVWVHYKA